MVNAMDRAWHHTDLMCEIFVSKPVWVNLHKKREER